MRSWRQWGGWLAFALAASPATAFAQGAPTAATETTAGDAAVKTKNYAEALKRYQASVQIAPSPHAALGAADALVQLGRLGDAYEAYADAREFYRGKLSFAEADLVSKRLKELAAKTGWLSIRTNEGGAEVSVDGKVLGTSPVPALVRFTTGPHDVKITKTGFAVFTAKTLVPADGKIIVEASLAPLATQGHVTVHAVGTESLRVLVDGVDVGGTPWEGDLPPGPHQITGRSSTATAKGQTVDVTAGSKSAVDLVSADTAAHLQIRSSDGKGDVYVDGALKGQGAFAGDLAPGPHAVVVSRDGYVRFEKSMTLAERQTWAETVTLEPVAGAGAAAQTGARGYEGLYGGLGLFGTAGIGGMGTELETDCSTLGAASCSTPNPLGGGVFGYLGWTFDPVGFELFVAGMYDTATQKATFDATPSTGSSVLPSATPARVESFSFQRAGGIAALRARIAFQGKSVRATLAGGPGLSLREIWMKRSAAASDDSGRVDSYSPGSVTYFSPALSLEAAVHFRLNPAFAVSIGAEFWADNASAGGTNTTPPSTGHALLNPATPATAVPIPTPQYHLATGPQVLLGPFIGLQFGP